MEDTKENGEVLQFAAELVPEVVVKLKYPVQQGTEQITELKIRRPKAKDMRDIPAKPTIGDLMRLAAKLAGYPPSVIDALEIPDFNRVNEVVGNFLSDGQ